MAFSADFIAQILHDIYQQGRNNNNTDISPALFKAILQQFNNAANEGFIASSAPDPDDDFRHATDNALFAQSHPYFPSACDKCDFYKPDLKAKLKYAFANRKKNCYNCPYIDGCISRTSSDGFKLQHNFKNGKRGTYDTTPALQIARLQKDLCTAHRYEIRKQMS